MDGALQTFLDRLRSFNAWYEANRDVASPAVFAFRKVLNAALQQRSVNRMAVMYENLYRKTAPGADQAQQLAYEELSLQLSALFKSMPPLLARVTEKGRLTDGS
jgi:hypothetical protein